MTDNSDSRRSRGDLVEDVRSLAATLEDSHPDPYAGHGGRVAFHRNLESLVRSIPDEGEPVAAFYERVAEFTAAVRDLHTGVSPPELADEGTDGRLPLGFRVVGDRLYVEEVYDEAQADLLGGQLRSVEEKPVADLEERVARVESADNPFGDRRNAAKALEQLDPLRFALDDLSATPAPLGTSTPTSTSAPTGTPTSTAELEIEVETADGETVERVLEPVEAAEPVETLETTVERPETDGEPAYRFLDDEGSTALLALPDMQLYRENLEMMAAMDRARNDEMARDAYETVVEGPVPDELDDVIAEIPSATEELTRLVEEMADAGTETLVVDTRDNGGGNSALTYIVLYVLHGWDGIAEAIADQVAIPKDSELYREQYGEEGPVGETANPAGFDFEAYFSRGDAERQVEQLRERAGLSPTFSSEVESGDYEGYYCPENVVVVTSAGTASAGTEPAFLLSKLGATVVGVPSLQAPNKPRDLLRDELPNSGLDYRVSFRHVEFCPELDGEAGDVFDPDVELTPDRFEKLDRAGDASVRLALDYASGDLDHL